MSQTRPKIVIKKYENRRLYDTTHSRYVNLDEVARLVREGSEVQVIDAKTAEDRTRAVLSQIILEGARDRELSLPLELLRQLVLATDSAGRQFLEWYLKNAMDTYQKVSDSLQFRFQEVQQAAANPLETVLNLVRTNPLLGQPAAKKEPTSPETNQEIEALHRRLEELEQRLKAKGRPRKPRKATRKA